MQPPDGFAEILGSLNLTPEQVTTVYAQAMLQYQMPRAAQDVLGLSIERSNGDILVISKLHPAHEQNTTPPLLPNTTRRATRSSTPR